MGGEAPESRRLSRALSFGGGGVPQEALHLVMGYVDDPRDREAASLVCRRWHRIDALTRKHVTVPWVAELAAPLECLKALHLRRMVVTDADLVALVCARGHMLQELKLDSRECISMDRIR